MRISDWSSDVCSSDLHQRSGDARGNDRQAHQHREPEAEQSEAASFVDPDALRDDLGQAWIVGIAVGRDHLATEAPDVDGLLIRRGVEGIADHRVDAVFGVRQCHGHRVPQALLLGDGERGVRSEEHTSELQSLMRTSYAVFCLKKKYTRTNATPCFTTHDSRSSTAITISPH